MLNTKKWKSFMYDRIFIIRKGFYNKKPDSSENGEIPFLIKTIGDKRLSRELGFEPIDLSTTYFPKYIFKYISSGGNASMQCDIVMDIQNLNRFIVYLTEIIKFKKNIVL